MSDVQPPELPMPSATSFVTGWDASNRFLRPRTFCLEHAVQVEKLMKPKGGANILVICHSGGGNELFIYQCLLCLPTDAIIVVDFCRL